MSEWITDSYPYSEHRYIYNAQGKVIPSHERRSGEPWKPIPKCEPYVKPKRFYAWWDDERGWWMIERDGQWFEWLMRLDKQNDECREAAERIADVYEVVMP